MTSLSVLSHVCVEGANDVIPTWKMEGLPLIPFGFLVAERITKEGII